MKQIRVGEAGNELWAAADEAGFSICVEGYYGPAAIQLDRDDAESLADFIIETLLEGE